MVVLKNLLELMQYSQAIESILGGGWRIIGVFVSCELFLSKTPEITLNKR